MNFIGFLLLQNKTVYFYSMKQKVLFIGLVWPEPQATAAGVRILQLVDFFQHYNYEIVFCSTAKKSDLSYNLSSKGVKEVAIDLNSDSFDSFLTDLMPDVVVFDRFLTEEQFGWRVEDHCPEAIKILDTEDLHFLRKSRLAGLVDDFSQNEIAKREIASIYRCDLSLIISEYEMRLLQKQFNISHDLLLYLPFLEDSISNEQISEYPNFENRMNFISIGNFKHEPNWRAVLKLKKNIWPLIRKSIPNAELHVYGAYATQKVMDLHKPTEGFIIKGWAENVPTLYKKSRVCLAPLEYGAGIKGKLLNSMKFGTPNVTTSIGSEGMRLEEKWNGFIEDSPEEFAEKAIELYNNKIKWEEFQNIGVEIFNKRFSKDIFYPILKKSLHFIQNNTDNHRSSNFIGAMLRHHNHRSTKYLSKYIEMKNKS